MNKTVNINLAGIFFHIDEDAYRKLSRYLEAIKRSFTDSQGRSEIIADIEARIAELFSERIQNEKQVVGIKLVDDVITIMGQPEDYLVDEEIFEDEPKPKWEQNSKASKKLFRDTDNSYIGGVAAGLAHYLKIDTVWVRLLWLLLAFGSGGTFILIYLVFWALLPEAITTAEKLTMAGDPVTISNIEKKIKDGFETVKEGFDNVTDNISETVKSVDFQKQGNRLKSNSQNFFDSIGSILMVLLKIFAKFIGIILIIVGIGALLALIIALFTVGITNAVHFPPMNFIDAANAANIPIWLMSTLLFFAVGIPFFFVFYLGLKILVNNLKSIGNVAKFTLLGVWLMAIIGLAVTGFKQASELITDAKVTSKTQLNIKANDTLKLSMINYDEYNNHSIYYKSGNRIELIEDENGKYIVSSDIRLIVRSTKEPLAYIIVEKEARGSSYNLAKKRAENIAYDFKLTNNSLLLNNYLTTDVKNKFSEQDVTLILYLPEGTILNADKNTYKYHRNYSHYNDILKNGMEEHYLKIKDGDVECLDCNKDEVEIDDEIEVETSNQKTTSKKQKADVSISINEDDGVQIEVNDN